MNVRRSRPVPLLLIASLLWLTGFLSNASAATGGSAGVVLVRPGAINDVSGSGSPPLPVGQDGDGFPDTDETVDFSVLVSNKAGQTLTNVVVRLWTTDARIACVSNSIATFGTVPAAATVPSSIPLRFRVAAGADRGGTAPAAACVAGACSNGAGACAAAADCVRTALDVYAARFHATVTADQLPPEGETDSFEVELDLDASTAAAATSTMFEGFEGGLTGTLSMNLDAGIASNALSDGKRCQYNDPDAANSNSYGETECYLGFVAGQSPPNDWHLHTTALSDGGRARGGTRSLHWGLHTPGNAGLDTYKLSQMDAIRTRNPTYLAARICRDDPAAGKRSCNADSDCAAVGGGACRSANPELSFAQQISTLDSRSTGVLPGLAADRGVVHVQIDGASAWLKLYPFENAYDVQGTDQFSNCTFDPDDDGNDEDDYFAPADPERRYGPSSTCFPEWAFSYLGDTDQPFAADRIGRASDGPGLPGALGIGTWVESKYDLSSFRGRAVRIRWLITTIKVKDSPTPTSVFMWNPIPDDDGWYVDDVRITQTLGADVPTATADAADRATLPGCTPGCASVTATLTAIPAASPAPGFPVLLSAVGSAAAGCAGGALLYEYGVDGNANGTLGDPADWMISGPAQAPQVTLAPVRSAEYGVRVRCATEPACSADATMPLEVQCPPALTYDAAAWWATLRFEPASAGVSKNSWRIVTNDARQRGDVARGSLSYLRLVESFVSQECMYDEVDLHRIAESTGNPAVGDGYWFLLRGSEPWCHEAQSWSTYHPRENPGDPGKRDREITICPGPPDPD